MNIFDSMLGRQFAPGPGVTGPEPKKGLARFKLIIHNHFSKLVYLNLLTLLFSLPVVTIPAALSAAGAVSAKLVFYGNCFLFDDFFAAFKREFLSRTVFGFLMLLPLAGCIFVCAAGVRGAGMIALLVISGIIAVNSLIYFPLCGCVVTAKKAFALSFAVPIVYFPRWLLMLLPAAATAAIHTFLFPYSLIALIFINVSLLLLVSELIMYPALSAYEQFTTQQKK